MKVIDYGYNHPGPMPPFPPAPPKPVIKSKPLQFKRGTYRAFMKVNPVLLAGEPAFEWDTIKFKIGDGVTCYSHLPYIGDHDKAKSAYDLWIEQGHEGTVDEFLESLIGEPGKSAYEIWLSIGHEGTVVDFVNWCQGPQGERGKSSYEVWLDEGNQGTVSDYFDSLKGKSAYEIWLDLGNQGSESDFIDSLKGKSAYQIWLDEGYEGTPADFINFMCTSSWAKISDIADQPEETP